MTTLQPAAPGVPPTQQATQIFKASDGKMRIDFPDKSLITNPAGQHAMLLDHVKKEFKIVPMQMHVPGMPSPPHVPGFPHIPALPHIPQAPHPPAMQVQDLGKAALGGHPVEGKQFTMAMPTLPKMPAGMPSMPKLPKLPQAPKLAMPKIPGAPQLPGAPKVPGAPPVPGAPAVAAPQAPAMPKLPTLPKLPKLPPVPKPQVPTVAEIWTSHVTGIPVMSKITGSFGTQTTMCQTAPIPNPPAEMFQAPPGYKLVK